MNTTILQLGGSIDGSLQFPYVSKFGVVANQELAEYIDILADLGHQWTDIEFNAFKTFVENGVNNGWFKDMLCIFPLFGNTPECLKVPLKQIIGNKKNATIGGMDSYEVPNPDWNIISEQKNGKYIGINPANNRYFVSPFSIANILNSINSTDGILKVGVTIIGRQNTKPNYSRWWGVNSGTYNTDGTTTYCFIRDLNDTENKLQLGLGVRGDDRDYIPAENTWMRISSYNTTVFNLSFGDINNPTYDTAITTNRAISPLITPKMRPSIGGVLMLDNNGDPAGNSAAITPGALTKWYSIDRGLENKIDLENYYRNSINKLISIIGK